jgi:hypothetical protein
MRRSKSCRTLSIASKVPEKMFAMLIATLLLVGCGKECSITWIDSPKGRLPVIDGNAFVRNERLSMTISVIPNSWGDDWADAYPEVRAATDDEATTHAIRLNLCSKPHEREWL